MDIDFFLFIFIFFDISPSVLCAFQHTDSVYILIDLYLSVLFFGIVFLKIFSIILTQFSIVIANI